jgi:hypothetical protein
MNNETQWTLGFLIGTPIWALLLLALIALIVWGVRSGRRDGWKDRGNMWAAATHAVVWGAAVLVLAVAIIASPLGYYPYKAEYHQWRPVVGQVESVNKRLISSGKSGMEERYVLTIDGKPYGVDDTRAATVKAGDTVSIKCKRDWQYASVPGYVCRWNQ